jgi:hypothetical protein
VIPVAADGVIAPARYFDLHGKTLRFTPSRRGYVLAASKAKSPGDLGTRLGWPDFRRAPKYPRSWSWRRSIPFGFPFEGSTWREVFVNSAGNLTFGRPEAELYQERETWPDGTMQALAGALNNRAAAGQEKMICALWGLYASRRSLILTIVCPATLIARRKATHFFIFRFAIKWLGLNHTPSRGHNTDR